jgi:hypothetical protein
MELGRNPWSLGEAGHEHDREAVNHIRPTNDAAMLLCIVRATVERGTFGGVEARVFTVVSEKTFHRSRLILACLP